MWALLTPVLFLFAGLQGAGVDLTGWWWLPALLLSTAVVGSAVNGVSHVMTDEARPTWFTDALILLLAAVGTFAMMVAQHLAAR